MVGLQTVDPRFDRFLYAPLCEQDEMTLSVLSALTRQNIDPWQLAARLDQLPKAQAVKTLAPIVQGCARWSPSEANETAVRLIGLLPSRTSFGSTPPSTETLKGYLMIWVLHGIFWGTLAFYAGNPQQTAKNYNDSSAVNAAVTKQARSSLRQPNTD